MFVGEYAMEKAETIPECCEGSLHNFEINFLPGSEQDGPQYLLANSDLDGNMQLFQLLADVPQSGD